MNKFPHFVMAVVLSGLSVSAVAMDFNEHTVHKGAEKDKTCDINIRSKQNSNESVTYHKVPSKSFSLEGKGSNQKILIEMQDDTTLTKPMNLVKLHCY